MQANENLLTKLIDAFLFTEWVKMVEVFLHLHADSLLRCYGTGRKRCYIDENCTWTSKEEN